ncbi:MAG: CBS domain-containing protein [Desulfobacterales bacterium]|nr:CBS domain-containing protein [Desulfobacterales bacterium]
MYVGLKMLRHFETVKPSTLVKDANKMVEIDKSWMLLVVDDNGKVIGYVRKEDVSAALPSMMTTLEKHEALYLMSKLTIDMIYRKDITTVSPATEIEVAAKTMIDKNLAGLAVVDDTGKLLGFINRSVMLDVLVEEMGLLQGGRRIAFEVEERKGVMQEVTGIISDMDISIIATGTFYHNSRRMIVLRIATDNEKPVIAELEKQGYQIVTAEDFKNEWQPA